MGDWHRPIGAFGDSQCGIDAEAMMDRGAVVADGDGVVFDERGLLVRGAVDGGAADAGAGEHYRIALAPVVPAALGVDARRGTRDIVD